MSHFLKVRSQTNKRKKLPHPKCQMENGNALIAATLCLMMLYGANVDMKGNNNKNE